MKAAELEPHEDAGSTSTRANIIAVVKGRDVELVNTQTKLDKLLSPWMTIATSRIPAHFFHLIYHWNVNLLRNEYMTDGTIKVDYYLRRSFRFKGQREAISARDSEQRHRPWAASDSESDLSQLGDYKYNAAHEITVDMNLSDSDRS